jgi:hypothetical protein
MDKRSHSDELIRLLTRGLDGKLQPADQDRLSELLETSDELQEEAVAFLLNDSLLKYTLAEEQTPNPRSFVAQLHESEEAHPVAMIIATPRDVERQDVSPQTRGDYHLQWNFGLLWPAATMAALVALVLSNSILLGRLREAHKEPVAATSKARLHESTLCLWDGDIPAQPGSSQQLKLNRSLRLLEGIAEVELDYAQAGEAHVQVEGPAGWLITDSGHPSLNYGKMTVNSSSGSQMRSIDTPMGRVSFEGYTSLGVLCFGSELEIHTFGGTAILNSLWFEDDPNPDCSYEDGPTQVIYAGQMLRMSIKDNAPARVSYGDANPSRFASMLSMAADSIYFDEKYEQAVRKDGPLAYWRFDRIEDKTIRNEMGDEYFARIVGDVETQGDSQNRYLVFGDSLEPESIDATIVTDTSFGKKLANNCSVEIWMKPSHYQQASIVGFVKGPCDDILRARHGLLLELTGPRAVAVTAAYPGRVRFLNRYPADQSPRSVVESSFSSRAYALRKWHHVVAVKDDTERRLYVNGRLESREDDPQPIDDDLSLILGRLHRDRPERAFAGQLDELAVYDYSLSEQQIRRHHELVRSVPSVQKGI